MEKYEFLLVPSDHFKTSTAWKKRHPYSSSELRLQDANNAALNRKDASPLHGTIVPRVVLTHLHELHILVQ